ncbi:hypothetical protein [Brevibacterium sediminis]
MARTWWVNQNSKRGPAINETVWAPARSKDDGPPKWHWTTMLEARAGDTIFHYTNKAIVGVSTAAGEAHSARNPYAGRSDDRWGESGFQIPVDYRTLDQPIPKSEIPEDVQQRATRPDGPFNRNGNVFLGYFLPVGHELASTLLRLAGLEAVSFDQILEDELAVEGPTDVERVTYGRAEQRALRKLLLRGRDEAECGLCGQPTSAKYLVAAHIKPRRDCTEEERRDPNIAMLACLMGCDAAFENGDLRVFGNGAMSVTPELRTSRPEWAARFQGARAAIYSDSNAEYFAARSRG